MTCLFEWRKRLFDQASIDKNVSQRRYKQHLQSKFMPLEETFINIDHRQTISGNRTVPIFLNVDNILIKGCLNWISQTLVPRFNPFSNRFTMESTNNPVWKKTWVDNPALNAKKNAKPIIIEPEVTKPKTEPSKIMMELSQVLNKRKPNNEDPSPVAKPHPVRETEAKPKPAPVMSLVQELSMAVHRRKSEVSEVRVYKTSFLFQFNKYVIVPILTNWLESKDLAQVEVAVTNKVESKLFLSWMQAYATTFIHSVLGDSLPSKLSLSLFHWIEKLQSDLSPIMHKLDLTDETMTFIEDMIAKKKTHTQYLDLLKKVRILAVKTTKDSSHYNYLWGMLDLPNLEELRFNGGNPMSSSINSHSLWDIAKACTSLRVCHLNAMRIVTDYAVQLVCQNCVHLSDFNISLCHTLTDASLIAITVYCRHLKKLNVKNLLTSKRSYSIFALHLQSRSGLTNLISNEFGDSEFTTFLHYQGSTLTALDVCNSALKDVSLSLIGVTVPLLTDLNVVNTNLSLEGLVQIVQSLPMLRSIAAEFNTVKRTSSDGDQQQQQNPLVVLSVHCFYLQRLSLQGNSYATGSDSPTTHNGSPSDAVRRPPVPGMPASALDLIGSSFANLSTLSLADYALTDDVLGAIAYHSNGMLTEVNLMHNAKLSDMSVCDLIEKSPLLRLLDVNGCVLLTDRTLNCLAHHCKRLVCLDVGKCDLMRKEGIMLLLDRSPVLLKLNVGPTAPSYLPLSLVDRIILFNAQNWNKLAAVQG